eukprot:659166-Rhodomonas_salina.1
MAIDSKYGFQPGPGGFAMEVCLARLRMERSIARMRRSLKTGLGVLPHSCRHPRAPHVDAGQT